MGEQEYDQETGLYHMGERYYDPGLGRWLSEDPAGIAGGLNLYAYVGNDPVNGLDPSGRWHCVTYWSNKPYPDKISCWAGTGDCGPDITASDCGALLTAFACSSIGGS